MGPDDSGESRNQIHHQDTTMEKTVPKEWAAVEGDEIHLKADSKEALLSKMSREGLSESDFEIVALPKSHSSMFV